MLWSSWLLILIFSPPLLGWSISLAGGDVIYMTQLWLSPHHSYIQAPGLFHDDSEPPIGSYVLLGKTSRMHFQKRGLGNLTFLCHSQNSISVLQALSNSFKINNWKEAIRHGLFLFSLVMWCWKLAPPTESIHVKLPEPVYALCYKRFFTMILDYCGWF